MKLSSLLPSCFFPASHTQRKKTDSHLAEHLGSANNVSCKSPLSDELIEAKRVMYKEGIALNKSLITVKNGLAFYSPKNPSANAAERLTYPLIYCHGTPLLDGEMLILGKLPHAADDADTVVAVTNRKGKREVTIAIHGRWSSAGNITFYLGTGKTLRPTDLAEYIKNHSDLNTLESLHLISCNGASIGKKPGENYIAADRLAKKLGVPVTGYAGEIAITMKGKYLCEKSHEFVNVKINGCFEVEDKYNYLQKIFRPKK